MRVHNDVVKFYSNLLAINDTVHCLSSGRMVHLGPNYSHRTET